MPSDKRSRSSRHLSVVGRDRGSARRQRFKTLDQYLQWFEQLLERSGGYLEDPFRWRYVTDDDDEPMTLIIYRQKLRFLNGTVLVFSVFVDEDITVSHYSFHFQTDAGQLIWRFDKHPGHRRAPVTHLHDNPDDPGKWVPHEEVDLSFVLAKIEDYEDSLTPR